MAYIRILDSLKNMARDAWNNCFPEEVEAYDYLLAIEDAKISGFTFKYLIAENQQQVVAATPIFITPYALDTTLQGVGKKITQKIQKVFPRLLTLKLACLGSPCTETGKIGFHPILTETEQQQIFHQMLKGFEDYASQQGCKLLGIKDAPAPWVQRFSAPIHQAGYHQMNSLPTAWLDINFSSLDAYFELLSYGTRKNMRRKLRVSQKVDIRHTQDLGDLLPQIMQMYKETRNRSEWQFEELTGEYFTNVLAYMPKHSFCTLYYVDNRLLAANLLLHDDQMLIDKFFCMLSPIGRDYNLYFLSWFTNIRYCLEHGIKRYQSGQAYYENKVRLGSNLTQNFMYFKHQNKFLQWWLKMIAPFLDTEQTAEDL